MIRWLQIIGVVLAALAAFPVFVAVALVCLAVVAALSLLVFVAVAPWIAAEALARKTGS